MASLAPAAPPSMAAAIARLVALPRRRLLGLAALGLLVVSARARGGLRALLGAVAERLAALRRPAIRRDFLTDAQDSPAARPWGGYVAGAGAAGAASGPTEAQSWRQSTGAVAAAAGGASAHRQRFDEFGAVFPPWLGEGLRRGGFEAMKPIQRAVLSLALAGRDVVGIAPTGSGKTLAFLVPALVHVAGQPSPIRASDGPVALVLAPTRELAVQIGSVADGLMQHSRGGGGGGGGWGMGGQRGFHSAVLYGGPRRTDQLQTLRFQHGTHLVVATPGRLLDFVRHGAFGLRRVSFFVLDEGDRMLDYGFEEDVTAISEAIRSDRQMLFFSATWPVEVEQAAQRLCSNNQTFSRVSAKPDDGEEGSEAQGGNRLELPGHSGVTLPPREIHQIVEVVESSQWRYNNFEQKLPMLLRHLEEALGRGDGRTPGKALIFVGTRNAAEDLGVRVAEHFGLDRCGVMHGARKQDQREATLRAFRDGRLRALVATDVVGRGVDIERVTHVVNFDFPSDIETYVHRVGRTGRNGQPGVAVTFFEPQPWYPELAHELAEVLRACAQEVPEDLAKEERKQNGGQGGAWAWAGQDAWEGSAAPALEERGCPALASAEELGPWDAEGARVWGYSANGGASEQGRLELRAHGLLRTTWGWGDWALVPSAPTRPPPRPPSVAEGEQGADDTKAEPAAASAPAPPAAAHLALTWNGVTDVVALDATGAGFGLVSRNGRPATCYRNATVGRALPGVEL